MGEVFFMLLRKKCQPAKSSMFVNRFNLLASPLKIQKLNSAKLIAMAYIIKWFRPN